jgi:DNA-binding MarR family transcriptional regulator
MKLQKELIEEASQSIQRSGTLTVLHTNAVASHIGISATEFEAMDIISQNQPITAGQLAEYCGLTTGAITGIVDRLERGKFVRRERDPEDRRRVFIVPIEDPVRSKKVRALYRPISEAFERCMNCYTPEQVRLFLEMHKRMGDEVARIITELHKK